jgi:hypothetical protein
VTSAPSAAPAPAPAQRPVPTGRISQALVSTRDGSINILALPERDGNQVAFEIQSLSMQARYGACGALRITVDGRSVDAQVADHRAQDGARGIAERVIAASTVDVIRAMANGQSVSLDLCDAHWEIDAMARARSTSFLGLHANRLERARIAAGGAPATGAEPTPASGPETGEASPEDGWPEGDALPEPPLD